jgi:hypothetical protein
MAAEEENAQGADVNPTEGLEAENEESENKEDDQNGEDGEYYTVEKIVGEKRDEAGVLLYRIKWHGYPSDEDSWEPATEIKHCVDIVREWKKQKKEKKAKKSIACAVLSLTSSEEADAVSSKY